MKENLMRNSPNQRDNSRRNYQNFKWIFVKNPLLLVFLGLIAGIIISNIVHNEHLASKKLNVQNSFNQVQAGKQIQVEIRDKSRWLTQTQNQNQNQNFKQNSEFEIIHGVNSRDQLDVPIIETDRPDEDINDQIQINNNSIQINNLYQNSQKIKPFVFVFIGIISSRENFEQREAVRDAWSRDCNKQQYAKCSFILSKKNNLNDDDGVDVGESNDDNGNSNNNNSNSNINSNLQSENDAKQSQKNSQKIDQKLILESQKNNDMVFLDSEEGYVNLAHKTLALFQHVAENFNASFLLKTDDDAFVFPDRLHEYLKKYCPKLVCPEQKLFIGSERRESEVILQSSDPKGGKWENYEYFQKTGLTMYLPYMLGGGYILSGTILDVLSYTYNRTGLIFSTMEDATVGLWLGGMEVKRIDDSRSFVTMGINCCFSKTRVQQHPVLGYFRLLADICRSQPRRIILHAVKNVTQMRYLGEVYWNRCKLKPVPEIL